MSQQEQFIQKWVKYLNDADHEMSLIAAQKLGKTRDPRVVEALVNCLTNRPDDMRTTAARALGSIGDPAAVPALIKLLDDHNSVVASAAADSLGEIGDSSAVPALIAILRDYKSGQSRHRQLHGFDRGLYMAAVYALQQINTREARQAVAKYHR